MLTRCLRTARGALLATLDTSGPRLRVHDNAGDAVLDEQAWVFDARGRAVERPPVDDESDGLASSLAHVSAGTERPLEDRARLLAVPVTGHAKQLGTVVVGVSLAP